MRCVNGGNEDENILWNEGNMICCSRCAIEQELLMEKRSQLNALTVMR